jgi:hypothetical protein
MRLTYTATVSAGSVTSSIGGQTEKQINASGSLAYNVITADTTTLILYPTSDFVGTINVATLSLNKITGGRVVAAGGFAGSLLGNASTATNGVTASSNITDLYSVIGDGGAKGVKVGPAIATAATPSTIAERDGSGGLFGTTGSFSSNFEILGNASISNTLWTASGNVGIGTNAPAKTLDIIGNLRTSSSVGIGEPTVSTSNMFEVYATPGSMSYGANFLTGGTASASGYEPTAGQPSNAFDGNVGTRWTYYYPVDNVHYPYSITYDLGAGITKKANKLRIILQDWTSGTYTAKDFTIQGSNDNITFDTVLTAQAANSGGWQEWTFANPTAYRYYKMVNTSAWYTGYDVSSIGEIQMMEGTSLNSSSLAVSLSGNVGIGTSSPAHLITLSGGAYSDGANWSNASDVNLKENFATMTPADILQKISVLSITQWNYKSETASTTHIGPTAQDFYAAFHLNGDNGSASISTIDPAGVALLGIQALDQKIEALQGSLTGNATTTGELTVYNPGNFSGDSVGEAKILSGQTSVRITFTQPYAYQPIVTATPVGDSALADGFRFTLEGIDASGFTIQTLLPVTSDTTFDWHSFASPAARLTVSDGSTAPIALIVPPAAPSAPPFITDPATAGNSSSTPDSTASTTPASAAGSSTPPAVLGASTSTPPVAPSPSAPLTAPPLPPPPPVTSQSSSPAPAPSTPSDAAMSPAD